MMTMYHLRQTSPVLFYIIYIVNSSSTTVYSDTAGASQAYSIS